MCALQLPFGRAYSLLDTKWTFLFSILMNMLGSAVCGSAPHLSCAHRRKSYRGYWRRGDPRQMLRGHCPEHSFEEAEPLRWLFWRGIRYRFCDWTGRL